MTHDAADALVGSPDTTSFVLVGTADPTAVRAPLTRTGLTVLDRDTLARQRPRPDGPRLQGAAAVMRGVAFASAAS